MAGITNKHIDKIKNIILGNLQRIVPQITDVEITMDKTYSGKDYVKIASTFFQTIPALFKNVRITGYAEPYVDEKGNIRLIFYFSYKWENYSGGTNGTDLGLMIFEIKNGHICVKQPFTYSN